MSVGILVSEYTCMAARGNFRFREMGSIHVKGRVDAYTPEDTDVEVAATV